jgi:hypothetical protein
MQEPKQQEISGPDIDQTPPTPTELAEPLRHDPGMNLTCRGSQSQISQEKASTTSIHALRK